MKKFVRYMKRPGSQVIEKFVFDTFKQAHRFEVSKLYSGWTGHSSSDMPEEIDVPGYEQLRLFDV